jgi:AraC family transcriptional regulator
MLFDDISTCTARARAFEMPGEPDQPRGIVADEPEWRALPHGSTMAATDARVIPTRWHAVVQRTREACAETGDDRHIVKIVLRNMNMRLSVAGRTVQDGIATPGTFHVTVPGAAVRCLFRGPYDVLHLHVPNDLIGECVRDMQGHPVASLHPAATPANDVVVERLARALLEADRMSGSYGQLYTDCISIAIVTRILASAHAAAVSGRPKVAALARWRLRRAIEYVETRLAEPVGLGDLASAAGLTRMHFAAQFRAATGLRPHEYLLRRRIERAQEMLVGTGMSLVDIALSVGFQTQSHFTTVFKRFTGLPPQSWRQARGQSVPPARLAGPGGQARSPGSAAAQLMSLMPATSSATVSSVKLGP